MRLLARALVILAASAGSCPTTTTGAAPTEGLVAHYPLNGNAADVSGHGNSGTVNGAVPAVDRYGTSGGCLRFDGLDDYVEIPSSPSLDVQYSMSIFAWIATEGTAGPIVNYQTTSYYGVHLWSTADCGPLCLWGRFVARSGYLTAPLYGALGMTTNWRFVGFTYDHTTGVATLWLDGQVISVLNIGITTLGTQYPVRMGRIANDARVYKGRIDDVRIYNRALSAADVQALYRGTEILVRDTESLLPLSGARVVVLADGLADLERFTNGEGKCWIPERPGGPRYSIQAFYGEGGEHASPVELYECEGGCGGQRVLGITGAAGIEVTGVVYDAFTNLPIEGADVLLTAVEGSDTASGVTGGLQTLPGGQALNFRLAAPRPGQYRLSAVKRGRLGSRYQEVEQQLYKPAEITIETGAASTSNGHNVALHTNVVMLLHGVLSSHAMWDAATVDALHAAGWAVDDGIDMAGRLIHPDLSLCHGNADVDAQAADVWRRAQDVGVWSFNVIAHSQGGVVARYLNERALMLPVIPKLIELGSPNHGSPLGAAHEVWKSLLLNNVGTIPSEVQQFSGLELTEWVLENALVVSELAPDSPLMRTLNHRPDWLDFPPYDWSGFCFDTPNGEDHLRPETRYLSIHGTSPLGDPLLEFAGLQLALFSGCTTNDGAVARESAILWETSQGNVINKDIARSHFRIANSPEVIGCCLEALARDDGNCGGEEKLDSVTGSDGNWGLLAERSVLLPAAGAIVDSLVAGAADSLMVAWSWYAGAPTMSLVAPDGAVIDSVAAGERADVRLVTGPTSGYYVVAAPAAGRWRWTVASRGTQATQAVDTRLLTANGPRIDLREQPTDGGLDRVLEARLESAAGVPLTGATVIARFETAGSGASESVMLDDGAWPDQKAVDGVYTCAAALPGFNATVTARVRASAPVGGQTVSLDQSLCLRAPGSTDVACAITALGGARRLVGAPVALEGSVTNAGQDAVTAYVGVYREPGWSVVGEDTLLIGPGGTVAVSFTDVPLIAGVLRFSLVARVGSPGQIDSNMSDNIASAEIAISPAVTAVMDGGVAPGDDRSDGSAPAADIGIHIAPNPANGRVVIELREISRESADSEFVIYDLRGRRVRQFAVSRDNQGAARAEWDFRDDDGRQVASGVYFVRASVDGRIVLRKLAYIE